jgi:hypothetical protein
MNRRIFGVAALALAGLLGIPSAAQAQASSNGLSVPVKGTVNGGTDATGTFTITKFVKGPDGGPAAQGKLVMSYVDGTGVAQTIVSSALAPVVTNGTSKAAASINAAAVDTNAAVCQILNLTLGPIDLNLLGLRVQTNTIVLNITADSTGGLLGSLLCTVANLLNNPLANLQQLLGSLNQLLTFLSML